MGVRRVWWFAGRRWWLLCILGAFLAALAMRMSVEHEERADFPHAQPEPLADLFSDFSYQPNVGAWTVFYDRSNSTTWTYGVKYECGPRCVGTGHVIAYHRRHRPVPEQGATALYHRVEISLSACTPLPLLPWPSFCDETDTLAVVTGEKETGALISLHASARCSILAAMTGSCSAHLRHHVDAHLLRVRAELDERIARSKAH